LFKQIEGNFFSVDAIKANVKANSQKYKLIAWIIFPLVVIDQLSKLWAWTALKGHGADIYLWDFFRFEYAENPGAFLSLGAQFSDTARLLIFNVAVAIFLVYVAFLLVRKKLPFWHLIAFTLLLGGGLGNLIDRVFRRAVIDFMNMGFGSLRTGIFNVADIAIMAGLILMIIPEKWLSERTPAAFKEPN
jgi:signal peptidase II